MGGKTTQKKQASKFQVEETNELGNLVIWLGAYLFATSIWIIIIDELVS